MGTAPSLRFQQPTSSPQGPSASQSLTECRSDMQRPAKMLRSLGSRSSTQPGSAVTVQRHSRPIATPSQQSEIRRLVTPILGSRGGQSAGDAASAVLAQRGMPEYAPLPPNKDKSKLTGFFFSQQKQRPPAEEKAAPKNMLASWRSRPWEEPEKEIVSTAINPLSMDRSKALGGLFRPRGW